MDALLEQRTESHGLSERPVSRSRLHHLHASLQDTLDTLVNHKLRSVGRRGAEALANVHQSLFQHAGVGRLENNIIYILQHDAF